MEFEGCSGVGAWARGRVLGRGASGTVYLAQLASGEVAAVKEINAAGADPGELQSAAREITLMRGLRHRNIVRYLGLEFDECALKLRLFLEFAGGGSLRQLIQGNSGPLGERRSARYSVQLLEGLKYLHAHGITHRDIKSANVLLSDEYTGGLTDEGVRVAKLADFGASKRVETLEAAANSGLKGTPHWMAPEVIKGQLSGSLAGWIKADVWSVGCTAIEMLTGETPWPNYPNPMAAMYKIAGGTSPPVSVALSPAARTFVDACCHPKPDKRHTPQQLLRLEFVANAGGGTARETPRDADAADKRPHAREKKRSKAPVGQSGAPLPRLRALAPHAPRVSRKRLLGNSRRRL